MGQTVSAYQVNVLQKGCYVSQDKEQNFTVKVQKFSLQHSIYIRKRPNSKMLNQYISTAEQKLGTPAQRLCFAITKKKKKRTLSTIETK